MISCKEEDIDHYKDSEHYQNAASHRQPYYKSVEEIARILMDFDRNDFGSADSHPNQTVTM